MSQSATHDLNVEGPVRPGAGLALRVSVPGGYRIQRRLEPVSGGVAFPRGSMVSADDWMLVDEHGREVAFDLQATDRWPDGSVRWAVLDAHVDVPSDRSHVEMTLRARSGGAPRRPGGAVHVSTESGTIVVDTSAAQFSLKADAPFLLASVSRAGTTSWIHHDSALRIQSDGAKWAVQWRQPRIESANTLRAVIAADGEARGPADARLELVLRQEFYADSAVVRSRLTIRNPRRAAHPGGIWELGDAGSYLLDEVSLVLGTGSRTAPRVRWSVEPGRGGVATAPVRVHQESSGGDQWSSPNHVDRSGRVSLRFRGYRGAVGDVEIAGSRATPSMILDTGELQIGAAVPQFWENFPRALDTDLSGITVSFLPRDSASPHELQGGEQKTHECYLLFGEDRVSDQPLEWCRSRLVLHAAPEEYARSGAIPFLVTSADDDGRYRQLVDAAIQGDDTFLAKRERADEYGWRHFGEVYGDHEAVRHDGPAPLMSHYNNQYDPVAGFLCQFLRTGDPRWWAHCRDLASHVIDIDLYHTDEDKAGYNHGLFWHTYHYVDAGKANHRTYPAGTHGGGPSSEQNYTTGLMLHYFVTGDIASREAALALAQFVIDMDDGRKTILKYLDRGYTGVASASRTPDYHGPGRGSANSVNALVDGHRLSGDRRFLEKAEQIIRRCTHPAQDIDALNLLDVENRWFYTMYLQALAKYLDWKIELGELDAMYGYGRDVLLHFVRWMAVHERPYLHRPEVLEYPTETWPAQDIRKSEIFDAAARHAGGEERDRFLERAEFFFDYSMRTLQASPTRTLARPVVLLFAHGYRRAYAARHGVEPAPLPEESWRPHWPAPQVFVTQKARAKRRLRLIAASGAALLLGAGTILLGLMS